jgi:hypothetical protein
MIWFAYCWACVLVFFTIVRMIQAIDNQSPLELGICAISAVLHTCVMAYMGYWIYTYR